MAEHIVPRTTYYLIFAALMIGTYLTVQMAYVDLGRFNPVVALGIAIIKATLVVLFFMHVRYSTRLTGLVVVSGVFWLGILLVLTLSDYLSRGWLAPWVNAGPVLR
jgi:cytochrome c oxidase subunit IV